MILNFFVYNGEQTLPPGFDNPWVDMGKTTQVVLGLVRPFFGAWRSVACDRFYTSWALFAALWRLGQTKAVGTIMSNRKGTPAELSNF